MRLVLASASPRRRGLLETAGLTPRVWPADVDESVRPGEAPVAYAVRVASAKACAVAARPEHAGAWVLAADTVVHLDGTIFGKPADRPHAEQMLGALAGRWHTVTTAWALHRAGEVGSEAAAGPTSGAESSQVRFRELPSATIEAYTRSGESADKAGAYGIQGLGAALVAEVRGSYSNVVGLPMEAVMEALATRGIHPGARSRP